MSKICWSVFSLWLCGLLVAGAANSYQLTDGTTISGDVVSSTENGLILRRDDDSYTDRLPWLKFSQDSLKQLAQNPKIAPFVGPFIEPPPPPAVVKKTITLSQPTRLDYLPSQSFLGALFGSPVILMAFLLIYAGNLFAAYEVAVFRKKPVASVVTTSAFLPILGPIIFLSMAPAPIVEEAPVADAAAPQPEPQALAVPEVSAANPGAPSPAQASASTPKEEIHIVASGFSGDPPPPPAELKVETFQRGQYMFNRRFFETKFAGFFGVVRPEADRGKVMTVKIPAALLTVERIARIGVNEVHFEVTQGGEHQEMMVAFADIQQIQLKQKA